MKAKVLVDNISNLSIPGEWGLSIYIEYRGRKILLDTGATGLFSDNARELGISLGDIDLAVLSHAHYDHASGMETFFSENGHAKLFLRKCCGEDCYAVRPTGDTEYIGMPKGVMGKYEDRLVRVEGDTCISDGIWLIPHKAKDLSSIGRRENLFRMAGGRLTPDNFDHEQSLVFETDNGLVIFNSCSHGGADLVINEAREALGGKPVYAVIGGFHLYNRTEMFVRRFAERVRETGIKKVYTGHCTGQAAFDILREELGDMVRQLEVGLELEL